MNFFYIKFGELIAESTDTTAGVAFTEKPM